MGTQAASFFLVPPEEQKHMGHWALCFGASSLKIKLWATAEYVGVWVTHNHGAIHVIAFNQSHNKKKNTTQTDTKQPVLPVQSHHQRSSI